MLKSLLKSNPKTKTIYQLNHDDSIHSQKTILKSSNSLITIVKEIFNIDDDIKLTFTDESGDVFISGSNLWSDLPSIIKFKCQYIDSHIKCHVDLLLNKYLKLEIEFPKTIAKIYDHHVKDSYKIIELVSKSSHSTVYIVEKNSNETFILKIVEYYESKSNEEILKSFGNRNIVEMFGVYDYDSKYHFYILEHCKYESLSQVLRQVKSVSHYFILDSFIQIYNALKVIWKCNYIHHNINLNNIGVCEFEINNNVLQYTKLKLMDFGLFNHEEETNNNIGEGYTCPNPNETKSEESDLYALGITLFKAYFKPNEDITLIHNEKEYESKLESYFNNEHLFYDLFKILLNYNKDNRDITKLITFNDDGLVFKNDIYNIITITTNINIENIKTTFKILGKINLHSITSTTKQDESIIINHPYIKYLKSIQIISQSEIEILNGLFNHDTLKIPKNSPIGDEGSIIISSLINLTNLEISEVSIGSRGLIALSELTNLKRLNLSNHKLGPNGTKIISKLVKLSSLMVDRCELNDESAIVISDNFSNLIYLDISHNNIGVNGAKSLSKLIKLKVLSICYTDLSDEGISTWNTLTNLEYLSCMHSNLGFKGAQVISSFTNLTSLYIEHNHIGLEGALLLNNLSKLKYLGLFDNDILDKQMINQTFSYVETLFI